MFQWSDAGRYDDNIPAEMYSSRHKYKNLCLLLLVLFTGATLMAQKKPPKPVRSIQGGRGGLSYKPDSLGNRVPDFSWCGYAASEKPIPDAPVKVVVPVSDKDATGRIQAALDYVASLPVDQNGLRGTVLLEKGTYEVNGSLLMKTTGVVLRGSGTDKDGTRLIATGTNRRTLIRIAGHPDRQLNEAVNITSKYVPVNAVSFRVASAAGLKAGDPVIVRRPSTDAWIELLGTDHFGGGITSLGWKPGDHDLFFDRQVRAVEGDLVTIDVPLTTALDAEYGGGTITKYSWDGRISNTGLENLRCVSAYDTANPKDEAHSWIAVTVESAQDVWVRQVSFEHFVSSAVNILETARRVTVEDCKSLAPVSEIGGQRRNSFITSGQQTLFQRCYAEFGYHDFATGYGAPGPNAFVQCESHLPFSFSGAIDSWASGVLFDMAYVDGNALRYGNRGQDGQGAGWCAANSVFWNCSAARIDCYRPPGAQNWAYGSWSQFAGDGEWQESNNTIDPPSLFYAQLEQRLKRNVNDQSQLLLITTNATSSPTVQQAAELTVLAEQPRMQLSEWIDLAAKRHPLPVSVAGVKSIDELGYKEPAATPLVITPTHVKNGWIVRGDQILSGRRQSVPWWSGSLRRRDLGRAKPAITRFVPGRTGTGLTDNLDAVTDTMKLDRVVAMEQNYGLWYDRRRDDHERIRRENGEVWPPFYELPFARTGQGIAWDGLSKYDLTKYNGWYWNRLKEFAALCDQKGLLLVHQNYFQHNIIEAGAHYADFPWRTANNINHTGFPEPPAYAGDKRIFMGEQFYDITNPVRRELHRKYIRQCLENFRGSTAVIQLTGEEFTGPLHFVKFWLDVIREWEQETGDHQLIGLSVTKDVQDAILSDPAYAAVIDIIDIRYWHYQTDGTAYAPAGGQNLAPRQHARLLKPRKSSFEQVYRAVSEYRRQYPGKAVIYSGDGYPAFGWAAFMAGGSLAALPPIADADFLREAGAMQPAHLPGLPEGCYALADPGKGYLIYHTGEEPVKLDLSAYKGKYRFRWVNTRSGAVIGKTQEIRGGKVITVSSPISGNAVLWVSAR